MTDKELIKQEIEKYAKEEALKSNGSEFYGGRVSMCTKILSFIDSLPEEPASEDKSEKELAEAYLAVFDRKYPILQTLKGEQKADFKNFLNKCQQEFGLKEFGIHPTQAKLFEKLALLWATWGAKHLEGLGKSNQDEFDKMSASEDLEEELHSWMRENCDDNGFFNPLELANHFAEWQRKKDQEIDKLTESPDLDEASWKYSDRDGITYGQRYAMQIDFKAGAEWQKHGKSN